MERFSSIIIVIVIVSVSLVQCFKCGKHERYQSGIKYSDDCFPRPQNTTQMVNGCFCVDNYKRDDSSICISKEKCYIETCKNDHETYRWGVQYSDQCNYEFKNETNPVRECFCNEGYKRNQLGKCTLENNCSRDKEPAEGRVASRQEDEGCVETQLQPPHAGYSTKRKRTIEYHSTRPTVGPHAKIQSGEITNKTTVPHKFEGNGTTTTETHISDRSGDDKCIGCIKHIQDSRYKTTKPKSLPKCTRVHEEYKCNFCEVTCDSHGKPCKTRGSECKDGCYCETGFARDADGECIPVKSCHSNTTPRPICPNNEELKCSYGCEATCFFNKHCHTKQSCKFCCVCKKDYARNSDNVCILIRDCKPATQIEWTTQATTTMTSAPKKCLKQNEEYKLSYGCELNCESFGKSCKWLIKGTYGCYCKHNYARTAEGFCVLIKDCPLPTTTTHAPNKCKPNEEFKCSHHCEVYCNPSGRSCQRSNQCKNGCYCKSGYARNTAGHCVPIIDCNPTTTTQAPNRCKPNEEFKCSHDCELHCNPSGRSCQRSNQCKNGCYCKSGYARNAAGHCVPINDCNPTTTTQAPNRCKPNEEYKCSHDCELHCNPSGRSCQRSNQCTNGCYCKNGYARNAAGHCVPINDCNPTTTTQAPNRCKPNEEYKCSHDCELHCNPSGKSCQRSNQCKNGCYCKSGYARNAAGHCVPINDCNPTTTTQAPNRCKPNEEFKCSHDCELQCNPSETSCQRSNQCKNGCYCKSGYARNAAGHCVPINDCNPTTTTQAPNRCKPNEEYKCSHDCELHCNPSERSCQRSNQCKNGCYCKSGYARNAAGHCVPIIDCNPTTTTHAPNRCKPNEEFKCSHDCELHCNPSGRSCQRSNQCTNGCYCKNGYARNAAGHCVPINDCNPTTTTQAPNRCKPNEEFKCSHDCELHCNPSGKSCQRSNQCKNGCYCKSGYARNAAGHCVPINDCNPTTTTQAPNRCKPNEEFKCSHDCELHCNPSERSCQRSNQCKNGCYCKCGYARNAAGHCVLIKDCNPTTTTHAPNKCKPHEEYKCSHDCELHCNPSGRSCQRSNQCKNGCYCKSGYARNAAGHCVPIIDCNPTTTTQAPNRCKPNEEFKCSHDCELHCNPSERSCQRSNQCKNGCYCKSGYARNAAGHCVPIIDCNPTTTTHAPNRCKPNEEFKCSHDCELHCNPSGRSCQRSNQCTNGCYCKNGYARNAAGHCVPINDCNPTTTTQAPNRCKPNEEFKCSHDCELHCNPSERSCQRSNQCKNGCYCKCGYARNAAGHCVLIKDCNPTTTTHAPNKCKPHEEYKCSHDCELHCNPSERSCQRSNQCKNGCYCKSGYARNAAGHCVPINDCNPTTTTHTPNKCKPHEEYKCSHDCELHCNPSGRSCQRSNQCTNGCYCKNGYARNAAGHCVPIKECNPTTTTDSPSKCDLNEEYKCSNYYIMYELYCNTSGRSCERSNQCKKGCYCKNGYKRNAAGRCIPIKEFNSTTTTRVPNKCQSNEEYKCSNACEVYCNPSGRSCQRSNNCKNGCYCKNGYARNAAGRCVPFKDCNPATPHTPNKCKLNEEYKCSYYCELYCNPSGRSCQRSNQCENGCYCKNGYARNAAGRCVPLKYCKPITTTHTPNKCKPYEEYKCSKDCELYCNPSGRPCQRSNKCKNGCYCKNGYARNAAGRCIPIKDCNPITTTHTPNNCKRNEDYKCSHGCELMCDTLGMSNKISSECRYGCYCKNGYARNGTCCVPIIDCIRTITKIPEPVTSPPIRCPNAYEKYKCSYGCELKCEPFRTACEKRSKCRNGCHCMDGFARNAAGYCIAIKHCNSAFIKQISNTNTERLTATTVTSNPCLNQNEVYKCNHGCEPRCAIHTRACQENSKCKWGCHCNEGFARNSAGLCVSYGDCYANTVNTIT